MTISYYTRDQAKKFSVTVKVSKNPLKKIDVFKDNNKIASIGQRGAKDYGIYLIEKGEKYANERRRLYRIRHAGKGSKVGSPGYWALKLLW